MEMMMTNHRGQRAKDQADGRASSLHRDIEIGDLATTYVALNRVCEYCMYAIFNRTNNTTRDQNARPVPRKREFSRGEGERKEKREERTCVCVCV